MKEEERFAHGIIHHLDVSPVNPFAESPSNGFEKGFFGCKSNGKTFGGSGLSLAAVDFSFGEDTLEEEVTPPGDEVFNPFNIHDIDACSKDHKENGSRGQGFKGSRFLCWVSLYLPLDPLAP